MSSDEKEKFKTAYIDKLAENLSMLRANAGVIHGDVADRIGIARQTYSAIECGRSRMSWNTFMSLILFFKENANIKIGYKDEYNSDDFYV